MATRSLKIPGDAEWAGYEDDFDVKYAHGLFFGKSIEEVQPCFKGSRSIERADELLYMPRQAFQYYVFAFAQYVRSAAAAEDSDAASCFLHLLLAREKRDPGSVVEIHSQLSPVVEFVASNQGHFDAPPHIYGSFHNQAAEVMALCKERSGGEA